MTGGPAEVPTTMHPSEVEALVGLAAGRRVLEIGSWYGHSTIAMARVAASVVSIDWHRGDPHAGDEDTTHAYFDHLDRCGVRHRVVSVVGRVEDVLPLLQAGLFDMEFIDAYHTYDQVLADARRCARVVAPGGVVAFHDYGRFLDEAGTSMVTRAVDEFAAEQGTRAQLMVLSLATVAL